MRQRIIGVVAAAALLAACEGDPQAPATSLTTDEASDLASAFADDGYAVMDQEMGAEAFATDAAFDAEGNPPVEVTREFEYVRPCPRGGTVTVVGTSVGVVNRDSAHVTIDTEATRTHDDCVRRARGGNVVLNGAPDIAMSAHFERQDGKPLGQQTIDYVGAFDWQVMDTDRAGTCAIDLSIVWERDADGGSRSVDGTVCEREIHRTTTWTTS